jgi:probable HAF family extracellular repeat protein
MNASILPFLSRPLARLRSGLAAILSGMLAVGLGADALGGTITGTVSGTATNVPGATIDLTRPPITSVDQIPDDMPSSFSGTLPYLDFPSSAGNIFSAISPAVPVDNIAGIFRSSFGSDEEGIFEFYLTSDDGAKLYVNDQLVVNNDGVHPARAAVGEITLGPNPNCGAFSVRVEYFDSGSAASLRVEWAKVWGPGQFDRRRFGGPADGTPLHFEGDNFFRLGRYCSFRWDAQLYTIPTSPLTATTDAEGGYAFPNISLRLPVVLTPSFPGGTFTPDSRSATGAGPYPFALTSSAPLISDIANQTIPEDGTATVNFTVRDYQTTPGNLVVTFDSSNPLLIPVSRITLGGSREARTATLRPLPNQSGSSTVTVTVKDGEGRTATDSFVVTVNAANDAPVAAAAASIRLDGINQQHLQVPSGVWFGNTFTVEAWVYVRSYQNWSRLFDFGLGAGTNNIIGALSDQNNGKPVLAIYQGTVRQQVLSSQAIPLNTWTHLAFTRDAGGIGRIFLNGIQTGSGPIHAPLPVQRTLNYIGRSGWAVDGYADADIADFRIWETSKTAAEILSSNHGTLPPQSLGLVLNYRFTESSGLTAFDSAKGVSDPAQGGAQNATVFNGALFPGDNSTLNALMRTPVPEATPTLVYLPASDVDSQLTYTNVRASSGLIIPAPGAEANSGLYLYTPAANSSGTNTLTYTVSDGSLTASGSVSVVVTPINDPPVAGPGTSLAFNGGNQQVTLPGMPLTNASFTIELWARRTELNRDDLFLSAGTEAANQGLHIGFRSGNEFTFAFWGNDLNTPAYTDTDWHHWACTYDSTTRARRIHRDGVLVAEDVSSSNFLGTGNLILGNRLGSTPGFKGELADLRVWTVARTEAEIARNRTPMMAANPAGLRAHYRLNEGSGTVAFDSAPVGGLENGSLINSPIWRTVDGPANSISLNGTSQYARGQYVLASDSAPISITGAFTLEAWVRPAAYGTVGIIEKYGTTEGGYFLRLINGRVTAATVDRSKNDSVLTGNTVLPLNVWSHIATSWDGLTLRVFVNGALDGASMVTRNPKNGTSPLIIGAVGDNQLNRFSGRIGDVRIWNVARSVAEISAWQGGVPATAPGLVLNYRFTEGSGSTLNDLATSDGAQNCALFGSPVWPAAETTLATLQVVRFTEDTAVPMTLPAFDIEGAALTYSGLATTSGTIAQTSGNQFLYTPAPNQNGPVTLSYTVSDGTTPRTAKVFLSGDAVEDRPTLAAIPNQTIGEGSVTTSLKIALTDGDPELTQNLRVTATSSNPGLIRNPVVAYTSPAETAELSYKPVAGMSGTSTITVTVTDLASNLTTTGTVTITVTAVDDFPNVGPATSLAFNGSNYASIPGFGAKIPQDEITIEFWQKANAVQTESAAFVLSPDTTSRLFAHTPWIDGRVIWDFGGGSEDDVRLFYTPPVSIIGSWQHFAFVGSRSGNYMKIFRNGIEEASKPGLAVLLPESRDLHLGRFDGQLAEFRVWKVARSSSEILASMHASLADSTPGLVAYYRFNQRPTRNLTDFASLEAQGGSQDGVLVSDVSDNDPTWQSTSPSQAWQSPDTALHPLQVVSVPDGTTAQVTLPAWDAENGRSLTWLNVTASTGTVAQVNGGIWAYTAPTGYSGPATLGYSVRDSSTNQPVSSSINLRVIVAKNEAPTLSVIPNLAAEEDTALIEIPFTVNDDQPASTLTIVPVLLQNSALIQSVTVPPGANFRRLAIVPKPGAIGTVHIRLVVQDAGGKTAQSEFDLRIEPKPAFSVLDLGVLPGKSASFGTAINDRGAVTGFAADNPDLQSNPVGFYFNGLENGGVPEFNPMAQVGPNPLSTPFRPWAINNRYTLAGSGRSGGQGVAWLKDAEGVVTSLGLLPGWTNAEIRALNDAGVLAGFATIAGGKKRGFAYNPGDSSLTDLGLGIPPFNDQSEAFGVNASNQVVGSIMASDGRRRAMIHQGGAMRPLFRVPNDTNSVAQGINAFGQVVGKSTRFQVGDSALAFDGIDDVVSITNLLSNPGGVPLVAGNAAHTVEAWIRVDALPPNRGWPLLVGNPTIGAHHWLINNAANGGELQVGIFAGGGSKIPVTLGAWMHVAATYHPPSSNLVTYVNGQIHETNIVTGVNLQGIPLKLGAAQLGENFFAGALDEVRIWQTTRTAAEVAALYTQRLTGSEPGLVAYLPFDEGSVTNTTRSLDPGALTATLSGNPTRMERAGLPSPEITVSDPVLELDGVGSRVILPAFPLADSSFTLEFRARRTSTNRWDPIIGQGTGAENRGLQVGFRPENGFTFSFWGDDLTTSAQYVDNEWHHWACTFDSNSRAQRIFRDGVEVASQTAKLGYQGTGPVSIGAIPFVTPLGFKGAFDNLRIWTVARTTAEIAGNLDQRIASSTPGLIAEYTFDEGGGNTTVNRVTGTSDGRLQGAITWAARDSGISRAFLYELASGRLSSLGTVPGGGASSANAINDFGQIVGTADKGIGQRAFFYSAGRMNDLNDLLPENEILDQWVLESATAINRSGAVVGTGSHGGLKRAFLALPATVIGRPVIQPQGAVDRIPQITLLKKHRPDDSIVNSFHWSDVEKRLYAIRPVIAKIDWFTSFTDTVGSGSQLTGNTNRIVSVTVNVWPRQPILHIAGAPVDLQPAITGANYSFQSLIYVTNNASVEPSARVFTSPTPGYTVAQYVRTDGQPLDPLAQPPYFEVIRTVDWQDSRANLANADWTIGSEVTEAGHREYNEKNGYVLFEKAAYDVVGKDRAYDRGTRLGPILPVNTERPGMNALANPDPLVVVWYRTNRIGVAWASVPVRYSLKWPEDTAVEKIVIANTFGSGFLTAANHPARTIYNQPDITQPGFNPNEEHAYMPAETLFAIRDDLNAAKGYSLPYALLKFRDPSTARWRMRVFKVIAEQSPYFFRYTGTVGKEIQPPLPLSLLPLSDLSYQYPANSLVGWEDYKGKFYARQAGPGGTHTNLVVRWYYPMQPGFFHPDPLVATGDPLAWMDQRQANALQAPNSGLGVPDQPIDVTYDIQWGDVPTLQVGESVLGEKGRLPDVFNMANARVIFDSLSGSVVNPTNTLARFYDPLSARTLTSGVVIPSSLRRQNISGKEYFIDLPWHLKIRLTYDPINQWLSFSGHLDKDFGAGEPLLLPNVLSSRERDRLKQLAEGDGAWEALMDRLYDLTRNPSQIDLDPFDGVPDRALRLGLTREVTTNFFEISGLRRRITFTPARTNYLFDLVFVTKAYYTTNDVPEVHLPRTIEAARQLDARLAEDFRRGTFLTLTGTAPTSSFSITTGPTTTIETGPKILTAGLGGIAPAQPQPGNALSFNGTSGWVGVGPNTNHLNLSDTPFTIEFWAKVTNPLTEQYLFGQPGGAADLGRLRLGFRDTGKFAFDLGTTPASKSIFTSSAAYADTNWHHWACTFDSDRGVQTIFRDGIQIATRTDPLLSYKGFGAVELGRFGSQYFAGQLDEVRIWKTARTGAEIRSQMHKRQLGSGVEPNLEVLYRCDESSGPLASDALSMSGGYVGTLSGGVSLVASGAPTGIPPRYVTIAENNDPNLGGLPVGLNVIRVDDGPFLGDLKILPGDNVFDERITLRHSSDFGGDPDPMTFQWYYKPISADFDPTDLPIVTDPTAPDPSDMRGWLAYTNLKPTSGSGVNDLTIGEGAESGLITLSDNAFICRYRGYAVNLGSRAAWSGWVGDPTGTPEQPRAALAEGWVKRVIRGLNPFDSRTTDFHSSAAATFSSMLIQAGARYEGPIAFNASADAINQVGLIEAYTTVLERAKGLSVEGVPPVDFNPANNALLLAATRLSDLYTLLGNEAYADATDPTIGFGSGSREYGSLASSIFAFQNQLDSLLEEELGLLRGRDDSAAGVSAAPIYNRLFWNFTLGEGEVAYQQNYNISDMDGNGFLDEKDARVLYPQGHGDAWGHYLTAMKQHYALLRHPFFTWVPRSEFVSVAGATLKVDFLDERKFATTAAAKARTGAEIVDLTYRRDYVDDPAGQWQGYKDTQTERAWGVSEWARRAGTGAYLDWITANTLLPSVDPNPSHTGIDRIDRQTVREIQEIPGHFEEIQARLDQADGGLNPLGLAKGVVPFDIDPSLINASSGQATKSHYEQIQDRAIKAMKNAVSVWNEVNKSTEALRRNQDSVEEFASNVSDQERDFRNRLIEIYGYPHAGDIGAGKTYPSGYEGPDLYHYMYVPVPDFDGISSTAAAERTAYYTPMGLGIDFIGNSQSGAFGSSNQSFWFPEDFAKGLANGPDVLSATNRILAVKFPRTTARYAFSPPSTWGSRRAAGEIQLALSDLIQNEARLRSALKADAALFADIEDRVAILSARYDLRADTLKLRNDLANTKISFATTIVGLKFLESQTSKAGEIAGSIGDATQEALPVAVGLANDATSTARSVIKFGALTLKQTAGTAASLAKAGAEVIEKIGLPAAEAIVNSKISAVEFDYEIRKQVDELERVLHQIATSKLEGIRLAEAVQQSGDRYQAALARGQRLLEERVAYRTRVSARTTESRYRDMTFRIFRNDALQKYRASFDLAQRYVFLAATAYDYESNLLGTDARGGRNFLTDIIRQRSIGQMLDGVPVIGRAGLADPLARMASNFDVLKTQLGFNNPQTETGRFSLRNELFRLRDASNEDWRAKLSSQRVANLWDLPEFRRYCRSFAPESAGPQPGIVIRFPSTVTSGENFFSWPLGGGDSAYDPSRFATKIRSVGVWFTGYNGLGLAQTPRVYLVPAGSDILSSPTANDFVTRGWRVVDQALPVPFPIGANRLSDPSWIPINDSIGGSFAEIRRFSSFRAYHDSGGFNPSEATSDSRLIGRSVWNTDWILIIPGQTFLANPNTGLDRFIDSVSDIKLFFQTYSYSGN